MNTKLMTHEEAVVRLKQLEINQRLLKASRDMHFKSSVPKASICQKNLEENKKEINLLLSVVFWHKLAKKMHFQLSEKEK